MSNFYPTRVHLQVWYNFKTSWTKSYIIQKAADNLQDVMVILNLFVKQFDALYWEKPRGVIYLGKYYTKPPKHQSQRHSKWLINNDGNDRILTTNN